jgi:threonine synthase
VEKAISVRPALPAHLADLMKRPERMATLRNDLGELKSYISERRAQGN